MITGSITLNNLTDDQVARILEAEAKNPTTLAVKVPQIQQYAGPTQTVSGVVLSWNNDDGYLVATDVVNQFFPIQRATEKAV